MIKYFCDLCGVEMPQHDGTRSHLGRLTAEVQRGDVTLRVEVIEAKNNVSNDGHFCRYCVLDALNQLDDRPRVEPPE